MDWKDTPRREYYDKYERVPVKNHGDWFEVYRVPGDVYVIAEPQHVQEVKFFLIPGSERALLFDTGLGFVDLRPLLAELYDGEIIVVNSHFHFDHAGGNRYFSEICCHVDDYVKSVATEGLCALEYGDQLEEAMFQRGYPAGFDPKTFGIPPYQTIDLKEGQVFDLGDRKLEVIYTPGHSEDGIMLYEADRKLLYAGDTFYLGALFVFFNNRSLGRSDLSQYRDTMKMLTSRIPADVTMYCCHNDFAVPAAKLQEAYELMDRIMNGGDVAVTLVSDEDHPVQLKRVFGDGFSIVYI